MTTYDEAWVKAEEAKRAWLDANGLYKTEDEHSSCGVGLVVAISGKPSRKVVENGINALKAVWHRGAVDADGMTGEQPPAAAEFAQAVAMSDMYEIAAARVALERADEAGHHHRHDGVLHVFLQPLLQLLAQPEMGIPYKPRIQFSAAQGGYPDSSGDNSGED